MLLAIPLSRLSSEPETHKAGWRKANLAKQHLEHLTPSQNPSSYPDISNFNQVQVVALLNQLILQYFFSLALSIFLVKTILNRCSDKGNKGDIFHLNITKL